MSDIIRTNLADFKKTEPVFSQELLMVWRENELCPQVFEGDDVEIMINFDTGYAYLKNAAQQIVLINRNTLEFYYFDALSGEEGYADNLSEDARQNLGLPDSPPDEFLFLKQIKLNRFWQWWRFFV